MHPTQRPPATTSTVASDTQHHDDHYLSLTNAVPDWLANATSTRRQAFQSSLPRLSTSLQSAPAEQHQQMTALNAAHWTAQSKVDQSLERLQDASVFAEPLLKEALKKNFDLDLDVRNTFVRLYIPATTPWFSIRTGTRAWTVSLLEAALHNFEAAETRDDAFEADSTFITRPSATGQFTTLPAIKAKLSIAAFTRLCRKLDIGAQYKIHLEDNLGYTDPMVASVLRSKIDDSQKAAMKAALQWARMNRDVSESYFRLIDAMLDGMKGLYVSGAPVVCHDMGMLCAPLTGIVVFAPDLYVSRDPARVVAYVPDDPEHPFKEYASTYELIAELTRQLRSKDYQEFFSRFVNHEHRGFFFSTLDSRLSQIIWHPPESGSSQPTWRASDVERPDLQTTLSAFHDDLWQHLYQAKLNKIFNDARVIAVPTAVVDQKARWAFWDSVSNIISTIVQTAALIVAPFVPVLGEAMMAYMAYQMLDEAFEGIIEWGQGRTTEAFGHLMSTVESLIQLGIFGAGGAIGAGEFRKVLPKEIVAFIDRFKPVQLANGQTRYWDPDLTRYQHTALPDANSKPNELGLHAHQGKQLLPLEDAHFAVTEDAVPGQYRIEHPTRPDAYQPKVRHNGAGAWHTELEQPLEWDTDTALKRINPAAESLSPTEREALLRVSGVNEDAVRKMHADQQTPPPLLADSIQRFKIDQQLQRLIDQLDSDVAEEYRRADPVTQLQLLTQHGRWPSSQRLRLVDRQGELIWQSSADDTLPLTELDQSSLIGGDLLRTLLASLDEQQIKALLAEPFGGPTFSPQARSQTLRKQLAHLARRHRNSLFESRYQALQTLDDPLAQTLIDYDPTLPASITRELLDTASGSELMQISEGQVPPRQQALMQLARQEVRVTRAYEGLELSAMDNPDSDSLTLHSLKLLPGWSGDVRIEIREGHYEGTVLDSIGREDAPAHKVLVRRDDGRYQPYDDRGQELQSATDFHSGLLYALPDSERRNLNLQIGQSDALKAAIREHSVPREELRTVMFEEPISQPAVDTLRLEGFGNERLNNPRRLEDADFFEAGEVGAFGIENQDNLVTRGQSVISPHERVQAIYRGMSNQEAQLFVAAFQNDTAAFNAELARCRSEYSRLSETLRNWEIAVPANDPVSGLPLTYAQRRSALRNRADFRDALLRCWRRQTRGPAGHMLQIAQPILGDLPALEADFSHVVMLSINGSANTGAVEAFMQHFPGMWYLDAQNLHLPTLPQALTAMPELRQLILRDCGITYSPANQAVLASLPRLSLLDLRGNPLGIAPDVSAIPSLRYLNLMRTGLSRLPDNLLDHPQLITGNFEGNQITEIPDAFFNLASSLSDGFGFAENPLSVATREQVKTFYNHTGRHFGVRPEPGDILRARTLFPDLNADQASEMLYRLPGTLAEGRAQLANWETELRALQSELEGWCGQIPALDPIFGRPLTLDEQALERSAREAFRQRLEQFWRSRSAAYRENELTATLEFIGDLPALSANFDHVSRLTLTGNKNITAVIPFIERFANLATLELHAFELEPVALSQIRMPRLSALELNDCGVVLTPENQATLVSLNSLHTLDLSNNPLGTFPDLNFLPELTYLDLSNCGLNVAPDGLANHPNLRTAIISNNRITEIPDAVFDLSTNQSDGFDFSDNPLSIATRNKVKTYYRRTGLDFDVRAENTDIAQMRELFPSLDEQEASDVIYDLPGTLADSRAQLVAWRAELDQMTADLTAWAPQVPSVHPITGEVLTAIELFDQYAVRSEFGQQLERFWRHRSIESGMRADYFESDVKFFGDLPRLTTDFSHVSGVKLKGNAAIGAPGAFIDLFSNARELDLQQFALGEIPQTVTHLSNLTELTLRDCAVTLSQADQTLLATLSNLELLDLSHNPLTATPDLQPLPALRDLLLSNSGITTLPDGMAGHPNLKNALLNSNRISDLPEAFFGLDLDLADGVNLASNPLSLAARERIKSFYVEHGRHFDVMPDVSDLVSAQRLYPEMDIEDACHMIYHLPGTLQAGTAQLLRWEAEISRMISELNTWSERVPMRDPLTGTPWSAVERMEQQFKRREFSQSLEEFWRGRNPDRSELRLNTLDIRAPFAGELPALSADFGHVMHLSIRGNEALNAPDSFLACFSGLQALDMRGFALSRVPRALTLMPSLETLVLNGCGVVFDATGQNTLTALSRLKSLSLYGNPLGTVPDVSALRALSSLDLTRTGITQVPAGIGQLPQLRNTYLSENAIVELPEDMSGFAANGVVLRANPLSSASRDRIKTYYQGSDQNLGVAADQADIALTQALYPDISEDDANRLVYDLPGTMAEGRIELQRRQNDLTTLLSELEAWRSEPPSAPMTGGDHADEVIHQENAKRTGFRDALEKRLRVAPVGLVLSDLALDLSFTGELPKLSGRFEQIQALALTSTANVHPRVERLLELFPKVRTLDIRNYQLNAIPEAVFSMSDLADLQLPDCRLQLTESNVSALAAMENLQTLDLSHNPLGRTPDLRNLDACQTLRLNNSGLTDIPTGLFDMSHLTYANLSDNAISQLPAPLPLAADGRAVVYDFRNNPLTPQSQQSLTTYNVANEIRLLEERDSRARFNQELDNFRDSDFSDGTNNQ
ncbi:dermonecrotic toxin domain-containing protein [Pseudomonas sp. NPDC085632]|uniref:dermonecrotic toxin domain-containing protein n=1 Tax=Pseudomonas sp. NPDC085632 TaxID=3364429 RepID=UPI0037CBC986